MAADRFVHWRGTPPSRERIQMLLEDFVGADGTVEWKEEPHPHPSPHYGGRFFIDFRGTMTSALRRAVPEAPDMHGAEDARGRWIEVYVGTDNIDVITRAADDFVHAVADGIAAAAARAFHGVRDEDDVWLLGAEGTDCGLIIADWIAALVRAVDVGDWPLAAAVDGAIRNTLTMCWQRRVAERCRYQRRWTRLRVEANA